jgi:hypothetical protein
MNRPSSVDHSISRSPLTWWCFSLALFLTPVLATAQTNSGTNNTNPAPVSTAVTGNVLWWTDLDLGTDVIPGGIALAGGTAVQASSGSDFVNKINAGGWQVVIFGEQNSNPYAATPGLATALANYLAGGGKIIGATWLASSGYAVFMQASPVDTNGAAITTTAHPIFAGLGPTIPLTNPGWGTYSRSWSPLSGAVGLGTLGAGSAVILGNGGKTLLNGPLFDTYSNVPQGQQFIANEINFLAGGCIASAHGHVSTLSPGHFSGIASPHAHHVQHGAHQQTPVICHGHLPPGHRSLMSADEETLSAFGAARANPEPDFVAALSQDGTLGSAAQGSILQLFGSAKGLYLDAEDRRPALSFTPPPSGEPLYYTTSVPQVQIGGVPAKVLFSGLAPGLRGVWQINVQVPYQVPPGMQPITILYEGDQLQSVSVRVE